MDFLTIDLVKAHCRIECYSEDTAKQRKIDNTIKKALNLAERIVYKYIKKDYSTIIKEYGKIPTRIECAALIATAGIINNGRFPTDNFMFELLLKPYKKRSEHKKHEQKQ